MPEKILLAIMVTLSVDLFLGVHLEASTPTASSPKQLANLLVSKERSFGHLISPFLGS